MDSMTIIKEASELLLFTFVIFFYFNQINIYFLLLK